MGKSINSPPNSPKIISGKLTKVKSIPKKTYPPKKKEINPNQAPPPKPLQNHIRDIHYSHPQYGSISPYQPMVDCSQGTKLKSVVPTTAATLMPATLWHTSAPIIIVP